MNALGQQIAVTTSGSDIPTLGGPPVCDLEVYATAHPLLTAPTANRALVWDAKNRLIGAIAATYQYDAQSRRIAKTTGTNKTSSFYNSWNCIADYTRSAGTTTTFTLQKTHLWGTDLSGTMQGAGGVGGLLLITDHSALIPPITPSTTATATSPNT